MIEIVVAIIPENKSVYYLSSNDLQLSRDDQVIIETEYGNCLGKIIKGNYEEKEENLNLPLGKVVRVATEEDIKKAEDLQVEAENALDFAKKTAVSYELEMSFVDSQFNLDKSVLIMSYVADNRVDFRELAKKLAQKYKVRIELRQIGVRDKAKRIGGLGPCGLFLCCNSFLTDFNSVSINMAKNQSLALSPSKINGICGRLLCCLGYENEVYKELRVGYPKLGATVETPQGTGKVISIDVLKGTYRVDLKDKGFIDMNKDENNENA